jgi:tyrosyl-tRNA synthetase
MTINRKPENGGDMYKYLLFRVYNSYEELVEDFTKGALHPNDLKPAVAKVINELIEPVRKHF